MKKLRDEQKQFMGGINFKAFESVLPSRMGMTDVDGELFCLPKSKNAEVERHRWFLRLEKKKIDDKMTEGQRIYLENLSDIPEFSVVVFWGSEFNPQRVEQWFGKRHQQRASLLDAVGSWWAWANKQPNAPRRD